MSYILEALKKSEHERNQGRPPDLRVLHAADADRQRAWLPWTLAAGAALVATGALLWTFTRSSQLAPELPAGARAQPAANAPSTADSQPTTSPTAAQFEDATASTATADADFTADIDATTAPEFVPAAADATGTPNRPLAVSDNDALSALLGELDVSAHVYSSDQDFRTITINGERRREGETLRNGVRIVEITPNGARIALGSDEAELLAFP